MADNQSFVILLFLQAYILSLVDEILTESNIFLMTLFPTHKLLCLSNVPINTLQPFKAFLMQPFS